MHALYNFLINPSDTENFNPKEPPSPSEFEDWFSNDYHKYYCDENNWYQGEVLVYSTGQIHQLCPADDWRGRDRLFDYYQKKRKDTRWQICLNSCAQCLAYDFNLNGTSNFSLPGVESDDPIENMDYQEIMTALDQWIVTRIDDVKKWFTNGKLTIGNTSGDFMQSDYSIGKFLTNTAHFINAYHYDHRYHMFSSPHSPYDNYRCIDIEGAGYIYENEEEPPVLCIAVVDIHT